MVGFYRSMSHAVKLAVVAMAGTVCLAAPAAHALDLLRSVPLEVKSYESSGAFPAAFSSPEAVMSVLNGTDNQLLHMEAIRRAYHQLGEVDRKALLNDLMERHREDDGDPKLYFDLGYAQVVFEHNKTGLYFLRKANDYLRTQFTAQAYASAQAEIDLEVEDGLADSMNTRKLDVLYLLRQAVHRDAKNHVAGFWPGFVRDIEQLKPLPAYSDLLSLDYSVEYVPYGNNTPPIAGVGGQVSSELDALMAQVRAMLSDDAGPGTITDSVSTTISSSSDLRPVQAAQPAASPAAAKLPGFDEPVGALARADEPIPDGDSELGGPVSRPLETASALSQPEEQSVAARAETTGEITRRSCSPRGGDVFVPGPDLAGNLIHTTEADLTNNGQPLKVRFYRQPVEVASAGASGAPAAYRVVVTNSQDQSVGAFDANDAPYIIEDIEMDGTFEFVIRQYLVNPYRPVQVYRFDEQCALKPDMSIQRLFE
ncbi:MAG: hypothetical protein AB7P76_07160 [Candidatus Melainabacteria bacterium]